MIRELHFLAFRRAARAVPRALWAEQLERLGPYLFYLCIGMGDLHPCDLDLLLLMNDSPARLWLNC